MKKDIIEILNQTELSEEIKAKEIIDLFNDYKGKTLLEYKKWYEDNYIGNAIIHQHFIYKFLYRNNENRRTFNSNRNNKK